jgi:YtoQ family protein
MEERTWFIYLSGEIHSDWRERIARGVADAGLPVRIDAPVCVHEDSDDCGTTILGSEPDAFWHDRKGAAINAIRTRTLINEADVVVVRFGEKYRQWNAAFDAGMAAAQGTPLITLRGQHQPCAEGDRRSGLGNLCHARTSGADPRLCYSRHAARKTRQPCRGITFSRRALFFN